MGQFQAWNKCLSHILTLARAHIESVMFERFLDGVNNCPDADCKKSLKVGRMCNSDGVLLHASSTCGGNEQQFLVIPDLEQFQHECQGSVVSDRGRLGMSVFFGADRSQSSKQKARMC